MDRYNMAAVPKRESLRRKSMRENTDYFPDGTPVDPWFYDPSVPFGAAGKEYPVLENGVRADGTAGGRTARPRDRRGVTKNDYERGIRR